MIIQKNKLSISGSRNTSRNRNTNILQSKNKSVKLKNKSKKKANSFSILSYNVSWESVLGTEKDWVLCNNNTDVDNPRHYSVCVKNIANVINDMKTELDYITLQEASNYNNIIDQSNKLQKMKYEKHISGLDNIITFWKSDLELLYTIKGEFEKHRPWMATIFSNGICLINVHMGHYTHNVEYNKLNKMMLDIKKGIAMQDKYTPNIVKRFIVSGDFNYNIKKFGDLQHRIQLNDINLYYNPKHILTCCIKRRKHNDHVIDSFQEPIDISIPNAEYMASDHKPVIAILNM